MSQPSSRSEALIDRLWPRAAPGRRPLSVYAVLDAARDESVRPLLIGSGERHECLYEGLVSRELLEVAPYLVLLRRDATFTRELLARCWGRSWGLFLAAPVELEAVRRHLRHFLKVKDERGRHLYFRFYDPRVMRVYLPTCNTDELRLLFGPLEAWLVEGPEGATLLRYTLGPRDALIEDPVHVP